MLKKFILVILIFTMVGCTPAPPHHQSNVCRIFRQYPQWYWATQDAQKHWGVPISVQMAIIHQESHFNGDARPARERILWVIPWKRPSSARGYSQALNGTWHRYQRETHHNSARNNFEAATDFLGWYSYRAHRKLGIPLNNAYALYLAYHEGIGGYARGTYRKQSWLIHVAERVQTQANIYHYQLTRCERSLPKKPWYRFW